MPGGATSAFQNESSRDLAAFAGQDVEGACGRWIVHHFQADAA